MKSCQTTLYFEVRKRRDLYLWLSATPTGPSIKFHVVNVHTMDELRLTGNCLHSSRPILSFDASFDNETNASHLRLIRELFATSFGTPYGHPKSQPFHDHVISFSYVDNKIWFRHYQIKDNAIDAKAAAKMLSQGEQPVELIEIGPRFVLDIIRIFNGSMGGQTIYTNPNYLPPNLLRFEYLRNKGTTYANRKLQDYQRQDRSEDLSNIPKNPLDDVFNDNDLPNENDDEEEDDENEEVFDDDEEEDDDDEGEEDDE